MIWWWDDDFISIPSKSFDDNINTLSIKKGYNKRKDCNLALVLVPKNFYMPAGKHCVHFLHHVWHWKCCMISDERKIFSSIHLHSSVPSILHWFTTLKTSLEKIYVSKLFKTITITLQCSNRSKDIVFVLLQQEMTFIGKKACSRETLYWMFFQGWLEWGNQG